MKDEKMWITFCDLPLLGKENSVQAWYKIAEDLRSKGLSVKDVCAWGGNYATPQTVRHTYNVTIPKSELQKAKKIFLEFLIDGTPIIDYLDEDGLMVDNKQINTVKELVKKAFGKCACANRTKKTIVLNCDNTYTETSGLAGITNQVWWSAEFAVGNFLNQAGSRLEVLSKYRKKAKKYAELYKETFGAEPIIQLVN